LGIAPSEGQLLKSIIDYIEATQVFRIPQCYTEILELFGVDTVVTPQTHELLLS
jgi:hypothetical protein